jgi:hypothetical protein
VDGNLTPTPDRRDRKRANTPLVMSVLSTTSEYTVTIRTVIKRPPGHKCSRYLPVDPAGAPANR